MGLNWPKTAGHIGGQKGRKQQEVVLIAEQSFIDEEFKDIVS